MAEWTNVEGENRGKIVLYALSTCVWCKKTRKLLDDIGVGYRYIYVDKLVGEDREQVMDEVKVYNPACSFPTMVVNDEKCVVGSDEDRIREALGL